MRALLFLFLACGGCASPSEQLFHNVDPELQQYFNVFTERTGANTLGITAGFINLDDDLAGECIWGGTYNEVHIDPKSWARWSQSQRQQLISHELGHCALFLQHINNCSDGTNPPDGTESTCNTGIGIPLSIMNWQMFTNSQSLQIDQRYYDYLKLNQPVH